LPRGDVQRRIAEVRDGAKGDLWVRLIEVC